MNMATSFLDASTIYGSTTVQAQLLRDTTSGLGRLSGARVSETKELLPKSEFSADECRNSRDQPCFRSGSEHVNLLPSLTALHTIFHRQHNKLAEELKKINPHWDDERIFQESRQIIGAQIQHITFSEFLPILIGVEGIQKYGAGLQKNGYYADYDMKIDPSTMNVFASAVGLFFWSMFPDRLGIYAKDGRKISERPLSEFFYNPSDLYFRDRLDGILRYCKNSKISNL